MGRQVLWHGVLVDEAVVLQRMRQRERRLKSDARSNMTLKEILDSAKDPSSFTVRFDRTRGGIGDVLMTLPAIRHIKQTYGCRTVYATSFAYLNGILPKIVENLPFIDEVVPTMERDKIQAQRLLVADLTCPCVEHEKPGMRALHRIDLFGQSMGLKPGSFDPQIPYIVEPEEERWARKFLDSRGIVNQTLILIQLFASTERRSLPLQLQREAIGRLTRQDPNLKFLAITHSSDPVPSKFDQASVIQVRDYGFREIAALASLSDAIIAPDSSILHLAAALQKPCLAIFGPTDPYSRLNYMTKVVGLAPGEELACQPCWYKEPCPVGRTCLKKIGVEDLIVGIRRLLKEEYDPPKRWDRGTIRQSYTNPKQSFNTIGELL